MSNIFLTESNFTVNIDAIRHKLDRQRPKTAISQLRPRPSTALRKTKIELLHGVSCSSFGKDAPHITIGTSRPAEKPPPSTPGPGAYSVPSDPRKSTRKIKPRFPTSRNQDYAPETTNIDLPDLRQFPEIKPVGIGSRLERPFYDVIESPGPSYMPPSTLSTRSHKIELRMPIKRDFETPGAGEYSPKDPAEKHRPEYQFSGPKRRDNWLDSDTHRNPGPSHYRPKVKVTQKKEPEWTIGEKSRRSSRRKHPNPPKSRFFGVDRFIVPLDASENLDADWKYIDSHPDIRDLIHFLMDRIIREKPEDPVGFIREYYMGMKGSQPPDDFGYDLAKY